MKIEKCPECHSTGAAVESDVQLVSCCPDCFHLFYIHGDQEPNGQSFLHFELLDRVGQGSNAIVFKARNIITGELRALKMFLCREQVDGESDFVREFDFAKSLIHPNIVQVFEGQIIGRTQYIEQELFEGIDLDGYLQRFGKMPYEDAIAVGIEVCNALDYVWSNYLAIHRDIKPHNILMNADGEIKICDFGMVNEHGEWFDERKIEGTPFYLSPESISGDYQDNRSDLYALGVTLYHMIAGVPPFDDPSLKKTIYARLENDAPDIRLIEPSVSAGAAGVLQAMMAREADERYVTAYECQEDLTRVLEGQEPLLVDIDRPHNNT